MAIVKVEKKTYTVDKLYQWDLNQVLQIHGLSMATVPEIHFTNDGMVRAVRRFATMDAAGIISADIPNALLQSSRKIRAIVCVREGEVFKSYCEISIPVIARPQPADYTITTDEDIYSFLELENLVYDSVASMTAKYNTVTATVSQAVAKANAAAEKAEKAVKEVDDAVTGKVSTTGDTMTGPLSMSGNKITDLGEPLADGDAVPKSYAGNADNLQTGTVSRSRLPRLTVRIGGTGVTSIAAGNFLVGGGGENDMVQKTPKEVRDTLAELPAILVEGVHYGAALPDPGTPGRLYFRKVADE